MKKNKPASGKSNIQSPANLLFPDSLRGKKYEVLDRFKFFNQLNTLLEEYLESENPDYLISAIQEHSAILQGEEKTPGLGLKSLKVDAYTIVWETISWWRILRYEDSKGAKKYLNKIGYALCNPRPVVTYAFQPDGIIHVTPREKGKKSYMEVGNPKTFIEYWNHIKKAFEAKKKRYGTITSPLLDDLQQEDRTLAIGVEAVKGPVPKEQDIQRIIKSTFGDDISIRELKKFNLLSIGKITASYIAWKHNLLCNICNKKKLSYKTILTLYKQAKTLQNP